VKKSFRRSDGNEEVIEGTPQEIADYERALKREIVEELEKVKKPRVLRGAASRFIPNPQKDREECLLWENMCPVCLALNCIHRIRARDWDVPYWRYNNVTLCQTSGG
jgi:hypothetical protein